MAEERTPGDEPVTNIAEADEEEVLSADPSRGDDAEVEELTDDGFEAVEGYQPREAFGPESLAAAVDETTQLRDIGEASFGPPPILPETVHGVDDRVQIHNTKSYPWRAHASLRISAADNSAWIGTGWFIGPRILVTAGHVVHIKGSTVPGRNGWVKRIDVMPGRNGDDKPFGTVTSTRFYSVVGWTQNGDEEYDYGAIILGSDLGKKTGWFGFGSFSDLAGVRGNISGYPGDKPSGTQWYDSRVIDSTTFRKVFYDIDTAGGQSGSAVYRIRNGHRYGFAVHAYGGGRVNSGTRINSHVFANLKAWKTAS